MVQGSHLRWSIPLALAIAAAVPAVSSGSVAPAGRVYGGVTAQGWPIVVQVSANGRRVARANIGIELKCTSGSFAELPDRYVRLRIRRNRTFAASFGPQMVRNPDGTTTDFQGSMTGALNNARTKASGAWRLAATDHSAAGVVTDTCDSGTVHWTARQ